MKSDVNVGEDKCDKFGIPYSEYPKCPDENCPGDNGVGLNYIGLPNGEDPHMRTDGGATFYCYACGCTFD